MKHLSPRKEIDRLNQLHALRILDTVQEKEYDSIALLASLVCETSIALITLVAEDRVWFKSRIGLPVTEVPRGSWFCEETIAHTELFVVPDAQKDERFQDNILVASPPNVRFYAGVPLVLDNGVTVGALCVLDSKARELNLTQQEMLKHLGGLAASLLMSHRNLAAAQDELEAKKELAESATKVKNSFLANMSHEIRTPLTAILGMTDLLLSSELTKEHREYIDTIRSSGESLLNTIDDILDFSKIESGRMDLDSRPLELRACIEETLDVVSQKAHAQGDELLYVIDANVPPTIVGDVARIRQILVNLISNAIKFTQNGEIFLSVHAQGLSGDEIELTFSVKDTGIGIPKDKLESIFQAFTQADSSVTRRYGGTGLGLVICSRLINLMGGRIGVESTEGQGSRFFFTMRTHILAEKTPERVKEGPGELDGRRVLIVDDSATNLKILSAECKQWGVIPTTANSPSEALRLLKDGAAFDLAIYDMQMPEKDGVQLATETLALRHSAALPIVLLSSWDLSDPRIRQNRELFVATVMKPLKMSQFESLLKSVVGRQPDAAVVAPTPAKKPVNLAAEVPVSIIVAEDNLINQKLIQRMLRGMGYQPTIVGTGLEVLNVLEHQPCDLVFMDVQMPEMDGLEATQKIRQRFGPGAGPRVIAMTAFALSGDKEKCLRAGMDDYLSKPFVSDQVTSMIRKWGTQKRNSMGNEEQPSGDANKSIDPGIKSRLNELEQETERSFVKELITIFFEEAPANFKTMKDAVASNDAKVIEHLAHKLKGGTMNLGARKLSGLFERVEELARKNVSEVSASLVAEVEQEFERTLKSLRDYAATV